ncbi:hypothetical protein SUGI_0485160 [Cryptomeria japonica]|nr:hypothetical protein SUGI_0485160 [Cryptomeria japonica]
MKKPALQILLDVNGGAGGIIGKPKGREFVEEDKMVVDLREEIEEDSQFWEKHAVIARIIDLNWSRKNIRHWVVLKGFFMVLFENHSNRDRILNQENWLTEKNAVYLQPWTPNFNPIPLVVYSRLKWASLYNLPIKYWGEAYLEKIGRMLGTALEINFDDENDL